MSRVFFILRNAEMRAKVAELIRNAPAGTRVELKEPRRTLPQNNKMWAMLTEISQQIDWHGKRLGTNDWKLLFLDALKRESHLVLAIDGGGYVNLKQNSSDLSRDEMAQLIELIAAFGARHFVQFNEENSL
jgi:hypothetical protein